MQTMHLFVHSTDIYCLSAMDYILLKALGLWQQTNTQGHWSHGGHILVDINMSKYLKYMSFYKIIIILSKNISRGCCQSKKNAVNRNIQSSISVKIFHPLKYSGWQFRTHFLLIIINSSILASVKYLQQIDLCCLLQGMFFTPFIYTVNNNKKTSFGKSKRLSKHCPKFQNLCLKTEYLSIHICEFLGYRRKKIIIQEARDIKQTLNTRHFSAIERYEGIIRKWQRHKSHLYLLLLSQDLVPLRYWVWFTNNSEKNYMIEESQVQTYSPGVPPN